MAEAGINGATVLLYVNTGTDESPVWTSVGSQRGVKFSESNGQIDFSSKDSRAKRVGYGQYSCKVTLDALYIPTNEAYLALKAACRDGELIKVRRYEDEDYLEEADAMIDSMDEDMPDQKEATIAVALTIDGEWAAVGS